MGGDADVQMVSDEWVGAVDTTTTKNAWACSLMEVLKRGLAHHVLYLGDEEIS